MITNFFKTLADVCKVDYDLVGMVVVFESDSNERLLTLLKILRLWGLHRETITQPLDHNPEIRIDTSNLYLDSVSFVPVTHGYIVKNGRLFEDINEMKFYLNGMGFGDDEYEEYYWKTPYIEEL